MSLPCPKFSMLRHRKLLFVSAVKQIAAQWFPLTSKLPSLAVIVISKPELHYLALPRWSPQIDYSHRVPFLLMFYFWFVVEKKKKKKNHLLYLTPVLLELHVHHV